MVGMDISFVFLYMRLVLTTGRNHQTRGFSLSIAINLTMVVFSRHFKLENSLNEFEKDPRGKPTFTEVFILQEKTVSIVGIAVFMHTIYLIQILSSINHVYG